jgi:hypothetical protein
MDEGETCRQYQEHSLLQGHQEDKSAKPQKLLGFHPTLEPMGQEARDF